MHLRVFQFVTLAFVLLNIFFLLLLAGLQNLEDAYLQGPFWILFECNLEPASTYCLRI
jgi:hypothetical protein